MWSLFFRRFWGHGHPKDRTSGTNPHQDHLMFWQTAQFEDLKITYVPHKAVAEVSKDKEPIGRGRAEFNWFDSQLMSDSSELRVKWFGCHLI